LLRSGSLRAGLRHLCAGDLLCAASPLPQDPDLLSEHLCAQVLLCRGSLLRGSGSLLHSGLCSGQLCAGVLPRELLLRAASPPPQVPDLPSMHL
jgi:hypothetical protein